MKKKIIINEKMLNRIVMAEASRYIRGLESKQMKFSKEISLQDVFSEMNPPLSEMEEDLLFDTLESNGVCDKFGDYKISVNGKSTVMDDEDGYTETEIDTPDLSDFTQTVSSCPFLNQQKKQELIRIFTEKVESTEYSDYGM